LYDDAATLTGAVSAPTGTTRFRPVLSRRERLAASVLVGCNIAVGATFVAWMALPAHLPLGGLSEVARDAALAGYVLLLVHALAMLCQNATLWVFCLRATDPVPVLAPTNLRVAVMTTIVPGKEPLELVARTLAAMTRIRYPGRVDVWILDEGDDPEVKRLAAHLGVYHFSRNDRSEYNQPSGPFKARTKAGNHNAWRAEHERDYDVVAQMDPDHVPLPAFLMRTLGYFTDPDVAFVVAPQVYGNLLQGFVQHAAASQAYVFHGVIQRGGNALGAPLLIGTNHLYRPSAWARVGGYQDSIIEDHLTAMHTFATLNPDTGNRYRGVYTPDIVAVGEGPGSWTDFFNQQKRWAYGIWQILLEHTPRLFGRLDGGQRLAFGLLQSFYPTVAAVWALGTVLALFSGVTGIPTVTEPVGIWLGLWAATVTSSLGLFLWLRRFNLVEHERRELGITGMAMLVATLPVYVSAGGSALLRRPLGYAVTAKGALASRDRLRTFRPHLVWAAIAGAGLGISLARRDTAAPAVWLVVTLVMTLAPAIAHLLTRPRRRAGTGRHEAEPGR
jgi:cellulose synthase/poly-beta-1,6-N-acetylglucosamine synthase-like glycosyltransferase